MRIDPQAQLVQLCERLVAATVEQQLEWEIRETTAFTCTRRSGTILVKSVDGSGEPPFELALFNTDGVKVESVLSESAGEAGSVSWNGAIATLYSAARRQALHAGRLVADLLADLPSAESTAEEATDS